MMSSGAVLIDNNNQKPIDINLRNDYQFCYRQWAIGNWQPTDTHSDFPARYQLSSIAIDK